MRLINVMAASVDGCIALTAAERYQQRLAYGFTNQADRQLMRRELHRSDAVIIGAQSVRSDDGLLVVKNYRGEFPLWVVLTRSGDVGAKFWQQQNIKRWLVAPDALNPPPPNAIALPSPLPANVSCHYYKNQDPAQFTYQLLKAHGIKTALLFGGSEINRLFYRQQLVDELSLTVCPFIFAGTDSPRLVKPNLPQPVPLQLQSCQQVDQHLFLRYDIKGKSHN